MIGFFTHLFIPQHSNNHRAKLLHHKTLVGIIVFILALSFYIPLTREVAPSVLGVATDINLSQLLVLTNQKRTENGLAPLTMNTQLNNAAAAKATDMFAKDYWAHNGPDGTTPWVFIQQAGYSYIYAGENLAKDFNNSGGVVDAWMASPGHKENLLNTKYTEIGFAIVNGTLQGQETTLVVQMFGARPGDQAAQTPNKVVPTAIVAISPTRIPLVAVLTQAPILLSPSPTISPTTVPIALPTLTFPQTSFVAGISTSPLINSASVTKRIAVAILAVIMLAFALDLVYIERKKLFRLVGHNLDHILFLAGAILLILLLGKGVIL